MIFRSLCGSWVGFFVGLIVSLSFAPFVKADDCPVNDCAVCGDTRETLGTGFAIEDKLLLNYLSQNGKNGCHVWLDKTGIYGTKLYGGMVFGCVDKGRCVRHARKLDWDCYGDSATECETASAKSLSKGDCQAKNLTCDVTTDLSRFSCKAESDLCFQPLRDYKNSFFKTTCPTGTESFTNNNVVHMIASWASQPGRTVRGLSGGTGAPGWAATVYCKWKPGYGESSVGGTSNSGQPSKADSAQ